MSRGDAAHHGCAVLLAVKPFSLAKSRLAPVLGPAERAELARSMATSVVAAAGQLPVFVICGDLEVAAWAESLGATVLRDPGSGLNPAVSAGVNEVAELGFARVIVAHGDLPLLRTFAAFVIDNPTMIVIAPDRHGTGTNIVSIPVEAVGAVANIGSASTEHFQFCFGPGSFARHQSEALRTRLQVRIVRDLGSATDIDTPSDLHHLTQLQEKPHEHS